MYLCNYILIICEYISNIYVSISFGNKVTIYFDLLI